VCQVVWQIHISSVEWAAILPFSEVQVADFATTFLALVPLMTTGIACYMGNWTA
jgi:hypothetical protein